MIFNYAVLFLSLWADLAKAAATLQVGFPINAQVPPVARISKPFSYTFAENTFLNVGKNVSYQLYRSPDWLRINSSTRTLYGIPDAKGEGFLSVEVMARDVFGTAIDKVTLVVSNSSGPYVVESLSSQLQSIGNVDGQGALILQPGKPFQISFSNQTFAETGGQVVAYYGTSDNHTPLPPWIVFDPNNITFTGTAPTIVSPIAPPQYFEFVLLASDYIGYSGISTSFSIVIGQHQLTLRTNKFGADISSGVPITSNIPLDAILLDREPIVIANISTVVANLSASSWLSFDNKTLTFSGIPDDSGESVLVKVILEDVFSDIVDFLVTFRETPKDSLFRGSLPNANATKGSWFAYTIESSSFTTPPVRLTVSFSGLASWLSFNEQNKTIYGNVPQTSAIGKRESSDILVTVKVNAAMRSSEQTFSITTVPSNGIPTLATPESGSTKPSQSDDATLLMGTHHRSSRMIIGTVLGVLLPILFVLTCIVLYYCYFRIGTRRTSASAAESTISRPIPPSKEVEGWPKADEKFYGEPRQLESFGIFKSTSDGKMSGYVARFEDKSTQSASHQLPPLPSAPGLAAVASGFASDEDRSNYKLQPYQAGTYASLPGPAGSMACAGRRTDAFQIPPVADVPSHTIRASDDSTTTLDIVSTAGVRLVQEAPSSFSSFLGPPIVNFTPPADGHENIGYRSLTEQHDDSGQTIGTYTSSESGYLERFGSTGESLSSASSFPRHMASPPQPWKPTRNSEDSYGSFLTTDSDASDEFNFDETHRTEGARHYQNTIEEEEEGAQHILPTPAPDTVTSATSADDRSGRQQYKAVSSTGLVESPMSPNWTASPTGIFTQSQTSLVSDISRQHTLGERVISYRGLKLVDFTKSKRPMSCSSDGFNTEESMAEIAFI